MKYFFSFLAFICTLETAISQVESFNEKTESKTLNNGFRLNFTPVQMPSRQNLDKTMGLAGITYTIPLKNNLYTGAAMHAAFTGDQGGLFTLGILIGHTLQLKNNFYVDTNFYFGGGGGYRNLVNDGGYINTNIGLAYKTKKKTFGIQYSYFDFYTGIIKSNSVSAFVEFDTPFSISKYRNKKRAYDIFTNPKVPFKKSAVVFRTDHFFPFGNSREDDLNDGKLLTRTLYLLGFEYQRYLNPKTYAYIHTDAVYKGLAAGFMDVFVGLGHEKPLNSRTNFYGKIGLGAAGGRIAREGGITIYPSLGIDFKFSPHLSLNTHGGYLRALDGGFEAYTFGLSLKHNNYTGGTKNIYNTFKTKKIVSKGIRISAQNQIYYKLKREERTPLDLKLIALQINYDLTNYFYITGQASFAYGTKHYSDATFDRLGAGGYADGMFGAGFYSPKFIHNKFQLFSEFLLGAGGGAGIDTGEGVIAKIKIGSYYSITKELSILISGGKIISPFTNLNSTNLNMGLSFDFSIVKSKLKR